MSESELVDVGEKLFFFKHHFLNWAQVLETDIGSFDMDIEFMDGGMVKKVVDAVKDLVPEVSMVVTDTGLQWEEMDSSHVSLVSLRLLRPSFATLVLSGGSLSLGVNMNSLSKFLHCGADSDRLIWQVNDDRSELGITMKPPELKIRDTKDGKAPTKQKKQRASVFSLKLINIEREALVVPETDYPVQVFMQSTTFARLIKQLSAFGENVTITVSSEEVWFNVEGDLGNGAMSVPNIRPPVMTANVSFDCFRLGKEIHEKSLDMIDEQDSAYVFLASEDEKAPLDAAKAEVLAEVDQDGEELQQGRKPTISLKFALRYLSTFIKCTTLTPYVQLCLSSEAPLLVRYPLYCARTANDTPAESSTESSKQSVTDQETNTDEQKSQTAATPVASLFKKPPVGETKASLKHKGSHPDQKGSKATAGSKTKSMPGGASNEKKDEKKDSHTMKLGGKRKVPSTSSGPRNCDIIGSVGFYLAPKEDEPNSDASQSKPEPAAPTSP